MNLNNLKPAAGSKFTRSASAAAPARATARPPAAATRARSRARATRYKRGFEGGQMPLHRRVPKRGFNNIFRTEYEVVNLDQLEARVRRGRHGDARRAARGRVWSTSATARDQGAGARRGDQGADGAGAQVQRQGGGEDCRRRWQGRSD